MAPGLRRGRHAREADRSTAMIPPESLLHRPSCIAAALRPLVLSFFHSPVLSARAGLLSAGAQAWQLALHWPRPRRCVEGALVPGCRSWKLPGELEEDVNGKEATEGSFLLHGDADAR